jgi:hypothetical protein
MGREIRTIFAGEPPIDGWLGFEEVKRDALRTVPAERQTMNAER